MPEAVLALTVADDPDHFSGIVAVLGRPKGHDVISNMVRVVTFRPDTRGRNK